MIHLIFFCLTLFLCGFWQHHVVNEDLSGLKIHKGLPLVEVMEVGEYPKIDGNAEDACWKKIAPIPLRYSDCSMLKPRFKTHVKIACSRDMLYILFICWDPDTKRIRGENRKHDGEIWKDNSVEIMLITGEDVQKPYHQIIVNLEGIAFESYYHKNKHDDMWNPKFEKAVKKNRRSWCVELAVPFKSLKLAPNQSTLTGYWRMNLFRTRPAQLGNEEYESYALSPTGVEENHVPEKFGYLVKVQDK